MRKKKELLIEAGIFCYSLKGVEGTRVEDITKKAGVAKGTFYTYFTSKEDLLGKIMEEKMSKYIVLYDELINNELSFEERVKLYLKKRFDKFAESPKFFFMILSLKKHGEIMLLDSVKESLGRRGDRYIKEFFLKNIDGIKEEYREELDIIAPAIMAGLFSYQDVLADKVKREVKDDDDYKAISDELKKLDIDKYVEQFYKLNIKEMVKED